VKLRRAKPGDIPALLDLINGYAHRGFLLRRSEESLRKHLHDFTVAAQGKQILGCGALTALAPGLAEIRSLAVRESEEGRGLGHMIARHLLDQAAERGFGQVLALTRRVSFFQALGFEVTQREQFLDKLAADCASCPMNVCCDETAMVRTPPQKRSHREHRGHGDGRESLEGGV
jgi:amino-acid N-acetyltransferase